ncbi:MAG TPA: transport-associated protein [Phycisphaerae bacterium]|nr:transport-associated protein [Phycisphaerae bacterium]
MSKWISMVLVGLMMVVGATLDGCKKEGTAEKAGKALDSAVKDAADAAKDTADAAKDTAEDAAKAVEEKAAE